MKIAVAGGTGAVGTHVVDVARERGHDVVVLTRSNGVDLVDGSGVVDALTGVDAVVDVTSKQTMSGRESAQFFTTVTRHLLAAEAAAGVAHHVALSIVGSDRAPYAYYTGKVAQEKEIRDGDVPWTVLRATQFHEFAEQIYGQTKFGPLVIVPKMRSQPVAAREVAERLVDLAEREPAGLVTQFGGPREESMADMVRAYVKTLPTRAWVLEIPVPGAYGKAMRDGTLLPVAGADLGVQTYREWSTSTHP